MMNLNDKNIKIIYTLRNGGLRVHNLFQKVTNTLIYNARKEMIVNFICEIDLMLKNGILKLEENKVCLNIKK